MFADPAQAIGDVTNNPSLAKYVRWIQPPGKPYLDRYRDSLVEFLASVVALVFLGASLIGTSYAISVAYRTERAQQTRARRLYGWSLWRACRRAFAWEGIAAALILGYFLLSIGQQIAAVTDPLHAERQASVALAQFMAVLVVIGVAWASLVVLLQRAYSSSERTRNA